MSKRCGFAFDIPAAWPETHGGHRIHGSRLETPGGSHGKCQDQIARDKDIFVDRRRFGMVGGRHHGLDTTRPHRSQAAPESSGFTALVRRYSAQPMRRASRPAPAVTEPSLRYLLPDQTCAGIGVWDTGMRQLVGMRRHEKQCGSVASKKTLASQLADARPQARRHPLFSRSRFAYGSCGPISKLFPTGHPGVQRDEYDWVNVWWPGFKRAAASRAEGDRDLFATAALMRISTPGPTRPRSQMPAVRFDKERRVMLPATPSITEQLDTAIACPSAI